MKTYFFTCLTSINFITGAVKAEKNHYYEVVKEEYSYYGKVHLYTLANGETVTSREGYPITVFEKK